MPWRVFRSTLGLYPLEANSGDSRPIKNIQINKVIGENEKYAFYLQNRLNGLFGQPNKYIYLTISLLKKQNIAFLPAYG